MLPIARVRLLMRPLSSLPGTTRGIHFTPALSAPNGGKKKRGGKSSKSNSKGGDLQSKRVGKAKGNQKEEETLHLRLADDWTVASSPPTLHPSVQSTWSKLRNSATK